MKTASYAAQIIGEIKRETKSKAARIRMAELAIKIGNYTPEAKNLWRQYLLEDATSS